MSRIHKTIQIKIDNLDLTRVEKALNEGWQIDHTVVIPSTSYSSQYSSSLKYGTVIYHMSKDSDTTQNLGPR